MRPGPTQSAITASPTAAADEALSAIDRLDRDLHAFVHVDPDRVRQRANELDASCHGGALSGLTIGVKDIFDTFDAPTEYGSPVFEGRQPDRDAAAVAYLRTAGAVIVGKTATAELACLAPPTTRNPHDRWRTPGGSSSGSAAAVAAGMVAAALGTQTAGSISRPASFCGVVGYKPSYGLVSRAGVLECAQTLDTVGVLASDVDVAARVGAVLTRDRELAELAALPPKLRVSLLVPRAWAELDDAVVAIVAEFGRRLATLGVVVEEIELPRRLEGATQVHGAIMRYELARSFAPLYCAHRADLSESIVEMIEEGLAYNVEARAEAEAERRAIAAAFGSIFGNTDLVVAPAASGEAPLGLESTGDPACAAPWTMIGVPTITVPAGTGQSGMPIGVSLVGPIYADRLALSVARAAVVGMESGS